MKHLKSLFVLMSVVACFAAAPTLAASSVPAAVEDNEPSQTEAATPPQAEILPDTRFQTTLICSLSRPSEVQRFNVVCSGATRVDVQIADCCIPGDHWEAKSKAWDANPNTAVTTSPGGQNVFGVRSRVHNYGGTPQNPGNINVEVDCSYIHGVNVFPAGSFVTITSDSASCTVTNLGLRDAINRTP